YASYASRGGSARSSTTVRTTTLRTWRTSSVPSNAESPARSPSPLGEARWIAGYHTSTTAALVVTVALPEPQARMPVAASALKPTLPSWSQLRSQWPHRRYVGVMSIATYKDLCIDVSDADRMSAFWSRALGLDEHRHESGSAVLRGATPQHGVWINAVPEERTVKQRVHIDVHAASVAECEQFGAAVLPDWKGFPWTGMADPEGGELCVFVRDEVPT